MSRGGRRSTGFGGVRRCLAAAVVAGVAASAAAQTEPEHGASAPASAIEQYLTERGLDELLAVYLLQQLQGADGDARLKLADRLGSLYVRLLDRARDQDERLEWEAKSQSLLKEVPEAESFELRLNLAKARYLHAEEIAERHRLRLAKPEDRQEAERILRTTGAAFQDIGGKLNRLVERLERREAIGRDDEAPLIHAELAEARRLRSLAMYYTGWSSYYSAFLAGRMQVDDALASFGWLLNAGGGRQANVERVSASLMRYEHVARAAIGSALCESLRGRDGAALLWLDAVAKAEGLPQPVTRQLFARRMAVLAAGKRWADLDYLIKRRRQPEKDQPPTPLELADARLLAVLTMENLREKQATTVATELIRSLADIAMTDLVTLGEVKHVQDLVTLYGSAPLSGEGFITQYIRGLQAYERAREAHAGTGSNAEEPTTDEAVRNLYRAAAGSLQTAAKAPEGTRFPDERSNAGLLLGLSFFYAGDLQQAADRFEESYRTNTGAKHAADALWLAIVALDKAVESGKPSLKGRLTELSTLYLQAYPRSERAARLLLRRAGGDLLSEQKAAEVLLGVDRNSPLYEVARRHAASLLYSAYRKARDRDRDFAALRFAEVSEELIRLDAGKLRLGSDADKQEAATQLLVRIRQVLDAVLGMSAPDLERAERAFQILDSVASEVGADLRKVDDEITYRRLQLALARSRPDDITRHLDRLRGLGGKFADAADRMMYKRSLAALNTPSPPPGAAAEVVRHGLRVMDQFGKDGTALSDPAIYSLHNSVSDAAARVWRQSGDSGMRDISVGIDARLAALGSPPVAVLKRYAELTEAAEQVDKALDAWRLLVAGLNPTAPEWFEARYHSLRLLAERDLAAAKEAMNQFRVLHPDFGPEPWKEHLRVLSQSIDSPAGPAPAAQPTPAGGPL